MSMDQTLAYAIFSITLWALGAIISLLIAYWIIRLAVSHSLRSHERWKSENGFERS